MGKVDLLGAGGLLPAVVQSIPQLPLPFSVSPAPPDVLQRYASKGGSTVEQSNCDGLWHCSLGCGVKYEKSSGRSIRRHMTSCFRCRWPGAEELSNVEVQALMSSLQESGQLVTGLRRWKIRQRCTVPVDLKNEEQWACPRGCGQVYRVPSSRSIQQHLLTCREQVSCTEERTRTAEHHRHEAAVCENAASLPVTSDSDNQCDEKRDTNEVNTVPPPLPLPSPKERIPSQVDSMEDDVSLMEEKDRVANINTNSMRNDDTSGNSSNDSFFSACTATSRHPRFPYSWEDTPVRMLLRRQQMEVQHVFARHFTEIVGLCEGSYSVTVPTPSFRERSRSPVSHTKRH